MKKQPTLEMLMLLAFFVAACAGPTPPPATTTAVPSKSGNYRFVFSGDLNIRDVPFLIAVDSLKEQGYTVEFTNLAEAGLVPEALARGDADLGSASPRPIWQAIAKGADLRTIVGAGALTNSLVARENIKTCDDLANARIGYGTRGVSGTLVETYLKQNCPGITPQTLILEDTSSRTAALLADEIDVAILDIENRLAVEEDAPGKFHVLANFAEEFPYVYFSVFNVRREWAEQHPEMVKDFIREYLMAVRLINGNQQRLQDELVSRLSFDAPKAEVMAQAHLNPTIWDPNGSLTPETLQANIDLLINIDAVPADLTPEDVADLTYLNAVLDEIGRR